MAFQRPDGAEGPELWGPRMCRAIGGRPADGVGHQEHGEGIASSTSAVGMSDTCFHMCSMVLPDMWRTEEATLTSMGWTFAHSSAMCSDASPQSDRKRFHLVPLRASALHRQTYLHYSSTPPLSRADQLPGRNAALQLRERQLLRCCPRDGLQSNCQLVAAELCSTQNRCR